jgi:hypothetical protein
MRTDFANPKHYGNLVHKLIDRKRRAADELLEHIYLQHSAKENLTKILLALPSVPMLILAINAASLHRSHTHSFIAPFKAHWHASWAELYGHVTVQNLADHFRGSSKRTVRGVQEHGYTTQGQILCPQEQASPNTKQNRTVLTTWRSPALTRGKTHLHMHAAQSATCKC